MSLVAFGLTRRPVGQGTVFAGRFAVAVEEVAVFVRPRPKRPASPPEAPAPTTLARPAAGTAFAVTHPAQTAVLTAPDDAVVLRRRTATILKTQLATAAIKRQRN